jgi:hypothetical protein
MNFGDARLPDRFWSKCIPEPNSGCWLWFGSARSDMGYGSFRAKTDVTVSTHRHSYSVLVGPIADSMSIDHLCNTPCCVNPAHMEVVTLADNTRRQAERIRSDPSRRAEQIQRGIARRSTHCECGRPYVRRNGTSQVCTYCHKARMKAWHAKQGNVYETRKAERERRKAAGICTLCPRSAASGHTMCDGCMAKGRARRAAS